MLAWEYLGHKSYNDYLNTSLWQTIRTRVLERDHHACRDCGLMGEQLQVHHRAYTVEVLEGHDDTRLITVCKFCHDKRHHHLFGDDIPYEKVSRRPRVASILLTPAVLASRETAQASTLISDIAKAFKETDLDELREWIEATARHAHAAALESKAQLRRPRHTRSHNEVARDIRPPRLRNEVAREKREKREKAAREARERLADSNVGRQVVAPSSPCLRQSSLNAPENKKRYLWYNESQ